MVSRTAYRFHHLHKKSITYVCHKLYFLAITSIKLARALHHGNDGNRLAIMEARIKGKKYKVLNNLEYTSCRFVFRL